MKVEQNIFQSLKTLILAITIILFPLFFLPFTQDFFGVNKLYLLLFSSFLLLFLSFIEFLITKKIQLQRKSLDSYILFFIFALILSILISSPNKIEAMLSVNFGLLSILSLVVISYYLRRSSLIVLKYLSCSSLFLALIAIANYFQPLDKINLPQSLAFLKSHSFTPIGTQLDLVYFLSFLIITQIIQVILISNNHKHHAKKPFATLIILCLNTIAIALTIFSLIGEKNLNLPPYNLSWYAAIEILKNPLTAFFGVGLDNFASLFTKVKDAAFNQSSLWQINSFNVSRSAILQIFSESGILGIFSLILLIFGLIKEALATDKIALIPIVFLLAIMLLFPPTLVLFFLFFIILSIIDEDKSRNKNRIEINFADMIPIFTILLIFGLVFFGVSVYFAGRAYVAEYYFKKSADALSRNNLRNLYEEQRQAILADPFIERFRINFSQTNLLIANSVAKKSDNLSQEDRNTIAQAIQAAIAEAKAAVTLNSQKATNWENLGIIYKNLLNVAQGADSWVISSYQRAIVLDPQNAIYRLTLGGIYYSLANYDESTRFFEQATLLKPDWSNAYYNLAWSYFQNGNYQKAVIAMEKVISLLNPVNDAADLTKAKEDLNTFKAKLPDTNNESNQTQVNLPQNLSLPSPPPATVEPKLQLPETASPSTR